MGMTIDNSIETLTSILAEATANEDAVCYVTSADAPVLKKAIDTMRKCEKIEEIYKNWCYPTYFNATDAMNKLGEVLKDGNGE